MHSSSEAATAWMAYGIQDAIMLRKMASGGSGGAQFKRLEAQKIQAWLAKAGGSIRNAYVVNSQLLMSPP